MSKAQAIPYRRKVATGDPFRMPSDPPLLRFTGAPLDLTAMQSLLEGPVRAEVPEDARLAVRRGRAHLEAAIAAGQPIYGTTTGVGAQKHAAHEGEAMAAFNAGLILAHQVGVGEPVPPGIARLAMALRLNTAASGKVGVSEGFVTFLARMLDADILPWMTRRGSVGCGDLGQMGQLATAMTGDGLVNWRGQMMQSTEALAAAGLAPYRMLPREGLAAVGSNSFGLASSAAVVLGALRQVRRAVVQATVTAPAWGLDRGVWETATRSPLPREAAVARFLLAASAEQTDWPPRSSVHDAISARFVVQILAAALVAAEEAAEAVRLYSGQVDDNPVILDDGRVQTSGGSHLAILSLRLSGLQAALAQLGRNIFNHCLMLTNGQLPGLTVNLVPPGVAATGYGPLMKVAMEQAARIGLVSAPVTPFALTLAAGLEDESLLLPLAAERIAEQIEALDWLLAIAALLSVQALAMRSLRPAGLAAEMTALVRRHLPPFTADQPLTGPLTALRDALSNPATCTHIFTLSPFLPGSGEIALFDWPATTVSDPGDAMTVTSRPEKPAQSHMTKPVQ